MAYVRIEAADGTVFNTVTNDPDLMARWLMEWIGKLAPKAPNYSDYIRITVYPDLEKDYMPFISGNARIFNLDDFITDLINCAKEAGIETSYTAHGTISRGYDSSPDTIPD